VEPHAGGADLTKVAYDATGFTPTVTNPLGEQEVYRYTLFLALHAVPSRICTEIDRLATLTTAAAVELIRAISQGRSLVIVEHDMGVVFDLAQRHHAPVALKDIGMRADNLDRAADLAVQNQYPNPRPLERAAIRALRRCMRSRC